MSTTINLKYPVKDGNEEISTITLRRATVRDILVMNSIEGNIAKTVAMVAQLSDLPRDVVETMDASDFAEVSEKVADFLG